MAGFSPYSLTRTDFLEKKTNFNVWFNFVFQQILISINWRKKKIVELLKMRGGRNFSSRGHGGGPRGGRGSFNSNGGGGGSRDRGSGGRYDSHNNGRSGGGGGGGGGHYSSSGGRSRYQDSGRPSHESKRSYSNVSILNMMNLHFRSSAMYTLFSLYISVVFAGSWVSKSQTSTTWGNYWYY